MKRRELLQRSAAFGFMAAMPFSIRGKKPDFGSMRSSNDIPPGQLTVVPNPLKPPTEGSIPVAFLVSEGAVIIDFCGPWEVFQDVNVPGRKDTPFRLYTVAETTNPIHASGGMKIIPTTHLIRHRRPRLS
jgi:hypothetical protein